VGEESNKRGKSKEVKRPTLLYLDKQKGKLVPFENDKITELNLQERNISDIQEEKNGIIWAATNNGSLIKIIPITSNVPSC